jgi:hypothetical protein
MSRIFALINLAKLLIHMYRNDCHQFLWITLLIARQ